MARGAIGLDIGTHTVHVAQVDVARSGMTVSNFGGVGLPEDAVREGEVIDPAAVGQAIKELVSAAKLKGKKVHLGVANQRVVVRQIDLPWMEASELTASLPFQVQEFIPIPVEEAQLGHHVLSEFETDEGARMLRLLLVAAQRDMVASHVAAAEAGGLKPAGVDLNPFAQLRALTGESMLSSGPEVLIDVGAGVTDIVVQENGVPSFVRILVLGGDEITDALAAGLGIDHAEAEEIKQAPRTQWNATAARIIDDHARQFVDEVRGSLDYYRTQVASAAPLSRLVVTGGGAMLDGLLAQLSGATGLQAELGNPFVRLATKGTAYGQAELAQVGPTLVTAIGLAIGGAE